MYGASCKEAALAVNQAHRSLVTWAGAPSRYLEPLLEGRAPKHDAMKEST